MLCCAVLMRSTGKLLQYHVQNMNKWEMFANYIFAKVMSFTKFVKILSREYFQVHGMV